MPVSLRALSESHIPAILEACSDWEELAQHGPPYWRPRSPAEIQRKIDATSGPTPATEYNFVLRTDEGRLVGECSLHAIDWRSRVAQVGICVWSPEDRTHGHGRSGVLAMVEWGFDHLGLHRLEAWIVDGNGPSQRLFTQLGFTHEATLRRRYLHAGVYRNVALYALIADDSQSTCI
ncbi:putative acetyltransferase [Gordonia polyisoprenivorans NBRC 16320 = JCM 10675]|uniref:GNAT family N-acetyltransferase n=1 Tax=Gordonia polyisoprenivorans TaxID=84595 RepID=A0A846WFN3_9ACTN|nr:GNAT family protein [Gordonia polyisoprenivorans]NKY00602.1 GNAT family N-acetyltransferase [Gordonia polyisoprenivorans]GAB25411.1 putative acetyltransferase [Gordonia polyisoprenivorans NBRC 16320 = JCM 10675]